MKKFLFISLLLFSLTALGQRIKVSEAKAIADSILNARVGEKLYPYFSLTTGHYTYKHRRGYQLTGRFKKKLPKKFRDVHFLYHFTYPEIKGIHGGIWVILDKNLNLKDSLTFEFIPQFIKDGTPCNFITPEKALDIATDNFKEVGIEITTPELAYNDDLKIYTYIVKNKLSKGTNVIGKPTGEQETIEVNAITGAIERLYNGYYGLFIR